MDVNTQKTEDFKSKNFLFQDILILLILAIIGLIIRSISTSEKKLKLLKKELNL